MQIKCYVNKKLLILLILLIGLVIALTVRPMRVFQYASALTNFNKFPNCPVLTGIFGIFQSCVSEKAIQIFYSTKSSQLICFLYVKFSERSEIYTTWTFDLSIVLSFTKNFNATLHFHNIFEHISHFTKHPEQWGSLFLSKSAT